MLRFTLHLHFDICILKSVFLFFLMRVLALSLADDRRRYERDLPPKGAQLLLNPDLEIAQLCSRAQGDEIIYQDEKAEILDLTVPSDLVLISTDFWQESRIREVVFRPRTAANRSSSSARSPRPAGMNAAVPASVVRGSILNVWSELRADAIPNRQTQRRTMRPRPSRTTRRSTLRQSQSRPLTPASKACARSSAVAARLR